MPHPASSSEVVKVEDSSDEEQTQAPFPPPKTQTLSPKFPAAKPQSQPSNTKNPTQHNDSSSDSDSEDESESGSGSEEDESESGSSSVEDESEDVTTDGNSKRMKFDGSSLCGLDNVDKFVMKKGLKFLGHEKRAEMKEKWKKLQKEVLKLNAMKHGLLKEQTELMLAALQD